VVEYLVVFIVPVPGVQPIFIAGINRSLSLPEVRSGHRAVDIVVSWGEVKDFYYGMSEVIVVLRQAIIIPSSEEEIRIKGGL
jgi:hypothetical protein